MAWAEERIAEPGERTLAHPKAIAAFLSRQEDQARALDTMEPLAQGTVHGPAHGIARVSPQSISEDESPTPSSSSTRPSTTR